MRIKKILALMLSASVLLIAVFPEKNYAESYETELETQPMTELETEFVTEEETDPETEPVTGGETEPETEPVTGEETEPGTEFVTEQETDLETEPVTDSEVILETELETEMETEQKVELVTVLETDSETETETEAEPETKAATEAETEVETEGETEADTGIPPYIGGVYQAGSDYYWDASWYMPSDFRFTKIEKAYAIAEPAAGTVTVYGDTSEEAQVVGELPYFAVAYILEENGEWVYIESGNVRGFVKSNELQVGDFADYTLEAVGEASFAVGTAFVEPGDNPAFTHTHTTVQDVIASKQYGLTLYTCGILEYADPLSRSIGTASSGDLVYILAEAENGWYFVESGDVRGFIDPSLVLVGKTADGLVETLGEDDIPLVDEIIGPEENKSCYFTLTSVKIAGNNMGADIAGYALSFVGNLGYVWGGTSLATGADCSGFTQAVFANYGVNIPRLAQQQGANGQLVPSLADAQVGDIVYYASGPHVGIYIGNGMVVQCSGGRANTSSNPGKGPTVSPADYMAITSIRRYLIQTGTSGSGTYRLDLTSYSQGELELIWAIVAQEDNGSYEGALAVISSAMNRTESPRWNYCGGNALSQLTARGQYCYSLDNYWRSRLHGNVPAYVIQAVNDCLKKGIRNHNYTSFRSTRGKVTGSDAVQIGGNWFFGA